MSYLTDLLSDARRRAMLAGMPMTPQEEQGIVNSAAQGAGERALTKKRLADELEHKRRQERMAKKAMAQQEKNDKISAVGNIYTLDKMTGGHLANNTYKPLLSAVGSGIENAAAKAMPNLYAQLTKTNTPEGAMRVAQGLKSVGSVVPGAGLTGGTSLASQLGTLSAPMTTAPAAAAASQAAGSNLMSQLGVKPLMSAGTGSLAGSTIGSTAPATTAGSTAASQGAGTLAGRIAGAVTPVVNIVGAASAARNIWGGDLERSYGDAGWSQKIARAPGNILANPGFGTTEGVLAEKAFGKNNPITKISNAFGKAEEKVVGKPLDKIFKAIGKVFCFAAGTPIQMEDGTIRNVEDIKIHDETREGGSVTGWGVVLNDDLYDYKGVKVAGTHAVMENGRWVRVCESRYGKPLDMDGPVEVYPVVNEEHVVIAGTDRGIVFADYAETDHGTNVNDAFRLEYMNTQTEWNKYLSEKYGC